MLRFSLLRFGTKLGALRKSLEAGARPVQLILLVLGEQRVPWKSSNVGTRLYGLDMSLAEYRKLQTQVARTSGSNRLLARRYLDRFVKSVLISIVRSHKHGTLHEHDLWEATQFIPMSRLSSETGIPLTQIGLVKRKHSRSGICARCNRLRYKGVQHRVYLVHLKPLGVYKVGFTNKTTDDRLKHFERLGGRIVETFDVADEVEARALEKYVLEMTAVDRVELHPLQLPGGGITECWSDLGIRISLRAAYQSWKYAEKLQGDE